MPKATHDPITGERAIAPEIPSGDISPEAAAAAVALTAPSILDLGRHLAAVEIAINAFDVSNLRRAVPAIESRALADADRRAAAAMTILYDRSDALREMISTMPAQTLQDVAVQVNVMAAMAAFISAHKITEEQATEKADRIERMAYGMLPVVAAAAGLGMEAMDWADQDCLRITRFDGVGVTS